MEKRRARSAGEENMVGGRSHCREIRKAAVNRRRVDTRSSPCWESSKSLVENAKKPGRTRPSSERAYIAYVSVGAGVGTFSSSANQCAHPTRLPPNPISLAPLLVSMRAAGTVPDACTASEEEGQREMGKGNGRDAARSTAVFAGPAGEWQRKGTAGSWDERLRR